jgi:hypothetical protein
LKFLLIYQSTFQRLEEVIVLHEKQGFFIPQPTVAELECKILAWHKKTSILARHKEPSSLRKTNTISLFLADISAVSLFVFHAFWVSRLI